MTTDERERYEFVRAICEVPNDNNRRLAYADWLAAHGAEGRAQFVRLQIEMENSWLYLNAQDLSISNASPSIELKCKPDHLLEPAFLKALQGRSDLRFSMRNGCVEVLYARWADWLYGACVACGGRGWPPGRTIDGDIEFGGVGVLTHCRSCGGLGYDVTVGLCAQIAWRPEWKTRCPDCRERPGFRPQVTWDPMSDTYHRSGWRACVTCAKALYVPVVCPPGAQPLVCVVLSDPTLTAVQYVIRRGVSDGQMMYLNIEGREHPVPTLANDAERIIAWCRAEWPGIQFLQAHSVREDTNAGPASTHGRRHS